MQLSETVTLDISDIIAILAALISGLSALYARWAYSEARRSNEITLLSHRKEIFDAFFELKIHMTQRSMRAELEQVSKFYYPSRDSTIYFESELSDKILKFYDSCFKVADLARTGNVLYPNESEEIKSSYASAMAISSEVESGLLKIIKQCATNR
ncbi:hypothetical protein [Ectopseudomonas guguanensis]|uniref:hypothetical protein n=1 Tax=Ectopseudomonas guguanensis TaxID=1198456 RepID=UPI0028594ABF|nr:hypothetical protein [Pseudomonas guguanensis]MDR8017252.1 hypothetical protein [Pseudomonas guguanensis]